MSIPPDPSLSAGSAVHTRKSFQGKGIKRECIPGRPRRKPQEWTRPVFLSCRNGSRAPAPESRSLLFLRFRPLDFHLEPDSRFLRVHFDVPDSHAMKQAVFFKSPLDLLKLVKRIGFPLQPDMLRVYR